MFGWYETVLLVHMYNQNLIMYHTCTLSATQQDKSTLQYFVIMEPDELWLFLLQHYLPYPCVNVVHLEVLHGFKLSLPYAENLTLSASG